MGAAAYERGDYATALRELRPLAEQGFAPAQYLLGSMLSTGNGVSQNLIEAWKWIHKAAEQGHADAQFSLSLEYRYRHQKNLAEAAKWRRKAAEQGHPFAQTELGLRYDKGQGVSQDYAEAVRWYREAAEQGHASAQTKLGLMYDKGQGVPQNYVMAHMWLNLAAAQGDEDAVKALNRVSKRMTSTDVFEAQRLAGEWTEKRQN